MSFEIGDEDDDIIGLELPTNSDHAYIHPTCDYSVKNFEDHRQVYIGVHHRPADKGVKRNVKAQKFLLNGHRKPFRWENGKKTRNIDDSGSETEIKPNQSICAPASERVKFILGCTDNDTKVPQENPQLFTELEELFVHVDGNAEWKETARWYKYEEDVEEGGDRWSKPHVATISLYSLLELRSSLTAGTIILDMDASSLPGIANSVLDNLISCNKLEECVRDKVLETLLRKHHHHRSIGFRRNLSNMMGRRSLNLLHNNSSNKLVHVNGNLNLRSSNGNVEAVNNGLSKQRDLSEKNKELQRNLSQPAPLITSKSSSIFSRSASVQGHLVYPHNESEDESNDKTSSLKHRLPANAEASNVLVGEVDFLERPITAFVRLANSSLIRDLTEVSIPTRFLFIMLGPALTNGRYHEIGRAISTLMADDVFHDVAYQAKSREDLIAGIDEFLEQVTVLPPGEWDSSIRIEPPSGNPKLSRRMLLDQPSKPEPVESGSSTGSDSLEDVNTLYRLRDRHVCGGLLHDLSVWKARTGDYRDSLNIQCLGAVLYIYFLLLSVIAIVGEYEIMSTSNLIGFREHLLSFGIIGIVFALFGGQPLLVMCYTFPVLMFEKLLAIVCDYFHFDFLSFRLWVGVWTFAFLMLLLLMNVSESVHYLTHYTLEVFSVLQPLVLISYSFYYLYFMLKELSTEQAYFFDQSCRCVEYVASGSANGSLANSSAILHEINFRDCVANGWTIVGERCDMGVTSFTLLIVLVTVVLMMFLRYFQRVGCFPKLVHRFLHDFAPVISVCIITAVVNQFPVNVMYLQPPSNFQPSRLRHGWFVPMFGANKMWVVAAAILPAMVLTAIVFTEQQVSSCYISRKRDLLNKGCGYHFDLLVAAIGVLLSSIFGLPFTVASLVLSVNNIQSLTVLKSASAVDYYGDFKHVREQRVTGLLVGVLILLTPTMRAILQYIPLAVLYGLLLFSLTRLFKGNQFVKRFVLLFIPNHQQRDEDVTLRQVPLISTNIVTCSQAMCVVALWSIRITVAAVAFPFMVLAVALLRVLLEHILPSQDIELLDEPRLKLALWGKTESNCALIVDVEQPAQEIYHNKQVERVNIGDELIKTATWKQLTTVTDNSPKDGKKRRKKPRTRDSHKDIELDENSGHHPAERTKHHTKRKTSKPKLEKQEDAPLPPWQQPYHSPPRKDFGLLKIPEDDLSVDPACSRDVKLSEAVVDTPPSTPRDAESCDASIEEDDL